jgi:hypothetical protein
VQQYLTGQTHCDFGHQPALCQAAARGFRGCCADQQAQGVFCCGVTAREAGDFGSRVLVGAVGLQVIEIAGEADVAAAADQVAGFFAALQGLDGQCAALAEFQQAQPGIGDIGDQRQAEGLARVVAGEEVGAPGGLPGKIRPTTT